MKLPALPRSTPSTEVADIEGRSVTLAESYEICRQLHKAHGTTYYWATKALPKIKQHHVHALYGLARYADEIVDEIGDFTVEDRDARLTAFEEQALAAVDTGASEHPVLKALAFTTHAWGIPTEAFVRFFGSMRDDLTITTYETYDDLMGYMDGSAAVIGEMMFPILEPNDNAAFNGARDLGIAFQLTNFLRDVGEDLDRGRVYFPLDELTKFGADINARRVTPQWRDFCRFQIERIDGLYRSADEAITMLPLSSRRSIRSARILYSEILRRIEANDFDVFSQRARVPLAEKLYVVAKEFAAR